MQYSEFEYFALSPKTIQNSLLLQKQNNWKNTKDLHCFWRLGVPNMRSKRRLFYFENSWYFKSIVFEIMKKHQWFPSNSPHGFTKHALEHSSKNASALLPIELIFESTQIAKSLNMLCFISIFTSSKVNMGGSQRGLKVSCLEAFLRQKRKRAQARVEKTSYAQNTHISYVLSLLFGLLV